jgi:ankyrin repeat protein
MSEIKERLSKYSSEHLLQMRSKGDDGLSEEANIAIEEIFAERKEQLPEKSTKQVNSLGESTAPSKSSQLIWFLLICVAGIIFGKIVAGTLVGNFVFFLSFFGVIGWVIYSIIRLFVVPILTSKYNSKKASEENLSEIMLCSAQGNLARIGELITCGHDVNAKSNLGATALFYAARNNQIPTIEYLLTVGADPLLKSNKGTTAIEIARKFGHNEAVNLLERSSKS